ncbi:MAG TPA: hypothetical protein VI094_05510 [Propionibacteriaceae bacterium]
MNAPPVVQRLGSAVLLQGAVAAAAYLVSGRLSGSGRVRLNVAMS